jgi:hypothetical protein
VSKRQTKVTTDTLLCDLLYDFEYVNIKRNYRNSAELKETSVIINSATNLMRLGVKMYLIAPYVALHVEHSFVWC